MASYYIDNKGREKAIAILDKALEKGYLTADEYGDRSALAWEARTEADVLNSLNYLPVNLLEQDIKKPNEFGIWFKRWAPIWWMIVGSVLTLIVTNLFTLIMVMFVPMLSLLLVLSVLALPVIMQRIFNGR